MGQRTPTSLSRFQNRAPSAVTLRRSKTGQRTIESQLTFPRTISKCQGLKACSRAYHSRRVCLLSSPGLLVTTRNIPPSTHTFAPVRQIRLNVFNPTGHLRNSSISSISACQFTPESRTQGASYLHITKPIDLSTAKGQEHIFGHLYLLTPYSLHSSSLDSPFIVTLRETTSRLATGKFIPWSEIFRPTYLSATIFCAPDRRHHTYIHQSLDQQSLPMEYHTNV